MADDTNDLRIVDNEEAGRWEAHIGEEVAVAVYQQRGDTLVFTHTEVPPALGGKGIASRLIKAALESAREQQKSVVPYCPFVAAYIRRHPDYTALVPEQYRSLLEDRQSKE